MANDEAHTERQSADVSNPYAAPAGDYPESANDIPSDVVAMRQRYFRHEAATRSISLLFYIAATLLLPAAVFMFMAVGLQVPIGTRLGLGLAYAGVGLGILTVGIGVHRLRAWARWSAVAIFGLYTAWQVVMVALTIGAFTIRSTVALLLFVIPVYVLYLLLSRKSGIVFSSRYHDVIRQTPHIKHKTNIAVKIIGFVLLALIGIAIFGAMVARFAWP